MSSRASTRPAKATDSHFAYAVRELTMRGHVEATWGEWNEPQVRQQIANDLQQGRLTIIEIDATPAGVMRVDEHGSYMHIDQLFLLPAYQGLGIGTELVKDVLAQAQRKSVPVRLWVLKVNPARAFYERLGFQVFEETAASLHLRSTD